ncbi:MAG: carbohydrate ABC transporter permease [Acidimicrobiales bacterium]
MVVTERRSRWAKRAAAEPDRTSLVGHSRATPYLLSAPSIIMVSALLAFPVVYAAWGSLFESDFIGGPQRFVGLQQYVDLFQDPDFLWSISRTFVFVGGVLVLGMTLGLVFGFALNRAAGKLRFLRGVTIVPYLVSGIATAVIFRLILNQDFGQVNRLLEFFGISAPAWFSNPNLAMLASILAQVWADLPLAVLLILGGLQMIDPQLMDAAQVDGANGWKRAWKISIPMITPQLSLATILLSYQALTSLGVIVALTGGGPVNATRTLPIALYESAFVDLETNEALAIVIIILLFNALLTLGYVGLSRRYDVDDQ